MRIGILVALGLTTAVTLLSVMGSGAPARVHVATSIAVIVGFTIPALAVGAPRDILRRWRVVVPFAFLGAFAWDVGAATTISKHELLSLPAIYIGVPLASILLLAIHGLAVGILNRGHGSRESPSNPALQTDDHLGRSAPSVGRR